MLEKIIRGLNLTDGFTIESSTIGLLAFADDLALVGIT